MTRLAIAPLLLAAACGEAVPANLPQPSPGLGVSVASFTSEPPERVQRFRSKRFALSLPLPDGRAWRIDDHTRSELYATHAPTSSTVVVATWSDGELVNRQVCEESAKRRQLVVGRELRTVEEATLPSPEMFDTRLVVAIEARTSPGSPLVGHVYAFGGFLRKCLFFHYSSEVPSARDEATLSARLAVARLRIFGGITLEAFAEPPRERR